MKKVEKPRVEESASLFYHQLLQARLAEQEVAR